MHSSTSPRHQAGTAQQVSRSSAPSRGCTAGKTGDGGVSTGASLSLLGRQRLLPASAYLSADFSPRQQKEVRQMQRIVKKSHTSFEGAVGVIGNMLNEKRRKPQNIRMSLVEKLALAANRGVEMKNQEDGAGLAKQRQNSQKTSSTRIRSPLSPVGKKQSQAALVVDKGENDAGTTTHALQLIQKLQPTSSWSRKTLLASTADFAPTTQTAAREDAQDDTGGEQRREGFTDSLFTTKKSFSLVIEPDTEVDSKQLWVTKANSFAAMLRPATTASIMLPTSSSSISVSAQAQRATFAGFAGTRQSGGAAPTASTGTGSVSFPRKGSVVFDFSGGLEGEVGEEEMKNRNSVLFGKDEAPDPRLPLSTRDTSYIFEKNSQQEQERSGVAALQGVGGRDFTTAATQHYWMNNPSAAGAGEAPERAGEEADPIPVQPVLSFSAEYKKRDHLNALTASLTRKLQHHFEREIENDRADDDGSSVSSVAIGGGGKKMLRKQPSALEEFASQYARAAKSRQTLTKLMKKVKRR
ncbi:unnamed protein product [Amoebophrya sp. A120]|nr:unnamed protein product [Amoebophrya sp. A120]|eukprot:GSA120T00003947001.1